MYIVSCRRGFWRKGRFLRNGEAYRIANVDRDGNTSSKTLSDYQKKIENKKVLLLCHGYNNPKDSVVGAYHLIKAKHRRIVDYFDVVVGFTWPGGRGALSYVAADARSPKAAKRFRKLLQETIPACSELGVMSHSLGCKVSLIAHTQLYHQRFKKADKHWQFLMAATVDDEAIENGEHYFEATLYCNATYVFHSKMDRVACQAYRLGEGVSFGGFDPALGCRGPEGRAGISQYTKVINCKRVITGQGAHGKYKRSDEVYEYISNELHGTPAPQFSDL